MKQYRTIPKFIQNTSLAVQEQKIPRTILQTFKTNTVPQGMYNAAMSWVKRNPDYSYMFYDDDDCRSLIEEYFDDKVLLAFDKIKIGAFKADLWRYCALFVNGGVYADLDTLCSNPLCKLITGHDEFISVFAGVVSGGIFNAFICSVPGHPFIERAIEKSVKNIMDEGAKCRHILEITGPLCLGDAINELIGREKSSDFCAQVYMENGYTFKILEKVRSSEPSKRKVVHESDDILMCKYDGYEKELEQTGSRHWRRGHEN